VGQRKDVLDGIQFPIYFWGEGREWEWAADFTYEENAASAMQKWLN